MLRVLAGVHRYATTSPIYVTVRGRPEERDAVLRDISRARTSDQSCADAGNAR